ncbi:hypothetical protein HYU14_06555 [Candidatus Woesearchaeota archaeon]|nr:hypothetical protein [Candidatus Woesearchaeota archaeon]
MALRRCGEELESRQKRVSRFNFAGEILMKTNIADFTVAKAPSLMAKLRTIFNLVDFERGDTLNVILGNNEASIIINEKYGDKLKNFLAGEKILNREEGLIALSIVFTADDFLHTPGVIFNAVRKLAWNNINIYEIVSTMTELTFILHSRDSMKAYDVLYGLVGGAEKKK